MKLSLCQTGQSEYAIYLPRGQQIAGLYLPPDGNYLDDDKAIKLLSMRYQLKS